MTLADALAAVIDTNYGDLGGGGVKPTILNLLDYKTDPPVRSNTEYISVLVPRPTEREPVNENFADVRHELIVRMSSPTSDDRLKIISDEVRRVIATDTVSGITTQTVEDEIDESDRQMPVFRLDFIVFLDLSLADSSVAYGG